ncbi:MAG: PH domain-containing protein [Ruminococcus sp.]|nr:PH domain-containing protein [Ruminococcus sp.]
MKDIGIDYVWTDKKRTIFGLPLSFTRYFLTENKLITRKGFLSIEEDELDLYKVTDKKMFLPLTQRLFKCGTISLHVKDVDTPVKDIQKVKKPRDVLNLIDKYINLSRDKYNIRGRDMMGPDFDIHSGDFIDDDV